MNKKLANVYSIYLTDISYDTYMEKWFAEAPTHHCALTVGHNAGLFKKIGDLMDIPTVVL